jgi:hypothetical protein
LSYSSGLPFGLAPDSDSVSPVFFFLLSLPAAFSDFSPPAGLEAASLALVLPLALLAAL